MDKSEARRGGASTGLSKLQTLWGTSSAGVLGMLFGLYNSTPCYRQGPEGTEALCPSEPCWGQQMCVAQGP